MDNLGISQGDDFSRLLVTVLPDDHNSHRPSKSHKLATALLRYIDRKSQRIRKTEGFVGEIRGKIHLLHQYNMAVEKLQDHYPSSRQLDSLIVKYVELEFDCLYSNHITVNRRLERETLQKVSNFLQIVAHKSMGPTCDDIMFMQRTKSILSLLADLKSDCFNKGKFISTLTVYLLNRFGRKISSKIPLHDYLKRHFGYKNPHLMSRQPHYKSKSDQTSDYESADSDPEGFNASCEDAAQSDGTIPRVTIELNDDDDTYMMYLQKAKSSATTRTPEIVLLSSDSEEEDSNSNKRGKKRKKDVVTFEILDDDDCVENNRNCNNYMVYIGPEVVAKKSKRKPDAIVAQNTAIALSDSEDEVEKIGISGIKVEDSNSSRDAVKRGVHSQNIAFIHSESEAQIRREDNQQDLQINVHALVRDRSIPHKPMCIVKEEVSDGFHLEKRTLASSHPGNETEIGGFKENQSESQLKEEKSGNRYHLDHASVYHPIQLSSGETEMTEQEKRKSNVDDLQKALDILRAQSEKISPASSEDEDEDEDETQSESEFEEKDVPEECDGPKDDIDIVNEEVCDPVKAEDILNCHKREKCDVTTADGNVFDGNDAATYPELFKKSSTPPPNPIPPEYHSTVTTLYNTTSFSAVISSPQGFPNGFNAEALANHLMSQNLFVDNLNMNVAQFGEALQSNHNTYVKTSHSFTEEIFDEDFTYEGFPDQKNIFGDFGDINVNEMIDPSLILRELPPKIDVGSCNDLMDSLVESDGTGFDDNTFLLNLLDNTPDPGVLEKYIFGNESDSCVEQLPQFTKNETSACTGHHGALHSQR